MIDDKFYINCQEKSLSKLWNSLHSGITEKEGEKRVADICWTRLKEVTGCKNGVATEREWRGAEREIERKSEFHGPAGALNHELSLTHTHTNKLREERKLKLGESLEGDKHCAPICHSYTHSSLCVCALACLLACFSCLLRLQCPTNEPLTCQFTTPITPCFAVHRHPSFCLTTPCTLHYSLFHCFSHTQTNARAHRRC